jgi:hypothetical protein
MVCDPVLVQRCEDELGEPDSSRTWHGPPKMFSCGTEGVTGGVSLATSCRAHRGSP